MGCEMKTYTDQHTIWRPDYPSVWNVMFGGRSLDVCKPGNIITLNKNITAFTTARNAIDKAMKQ